MFKKLFLTMSILSIIAFGNVNAIITDSQKIIGKTAAEYLKNNPVVFAEIVDSLQEYNKKKEDNKQKYKLERHGNSLFDTSNGNPVVGNESGMIEIVVFTDPLCHFCRQFEKTLQDAIKADKDLKVIFRDIAIMDKKSLMLIKATVAASMQGKYSQMQSAVHSVDTSVTQEDIFKMAKDINLDLDTFKKDINSEKIKKLIKNNMDLADGIDLTATPTFIIKGTNKIISGAIPLKDLQKLLK